MNKVIRILLAFAILCSCINIGLISGAEEVQPLNVSEDDETITIPGEFVISSSYAWNDSSLQALISQLPSYTIETLVYIEAINDAPALYIYLLKLADPSFHDAAYNLLSSSSVLNVEVNYESIQSDMEAFIAPTIESDFYEQWGRAKIGVPSAWSMSFNGSSNVKIAVMDTGVVLHDDFADNVDMSLARCFIGGNESTDVTDTNGHGTFITGLLASEVNEVGIDGLCENITIIPIKVTTGASLDYSDCIKAINYCASIGVDVISCSLLFSKANDAINATIERFPGLFVHSSGNGSKNFDASISNLDGRCNNVPNWVVVGASDQNDNKASFSNYSAVYVDLFAPGVAIWSTHKDGSYRRSQGTSFAAPHVTAAAALIMSKATHLTPVQVKQLLMDTVDPVAALNGLCVSDGRLNVNNAVEYLYAQQRPAFSLGDVTGDGFVNSFDYIAVRNYIRGGSMNDAGLTAADIDGDSAITSVDMMLINQYISKALYFAPY